MATHQTVARVMPRASGRGAGSGVSGANGTETAGLMDTMRVRIRLMYTEKEMRIFCRGTRRKGAAVVKQGETLGALTTARATDIKTWPGASEQARAGQGSSIIIAEDPLAPPHHLP